MYDIVFISYQEPNAQHRYSMLKQRFPYAKRIHGVKGIHQAHIEAAKISVTDMFWAIDADAIIVEDFDFSYIPKVEEQEWVHVWHSKNPLNDLQLANYLTKVYHVLVVLTSNLLLHVLRRYSL